MKKLKTSFSIDVMKVLEQMSKTTFYVHFRTGFTKNVAKFTENTCTAANI